MRSGADGLPKAGGYSHGMRLRLVRFAEGVRQLCKSITVDETRVLEAFDIGVEPGPVDGVSGVSMVSSAIQRDCVCGDSPK